MAVNLKRKAAFGFGLIFSVFTGMVKGTNIALGKTVTMSSLYNNESYWSNAVDGNTSGDWYDFSCASTLKDTNPWLLLDLGSTYTVTAMKIYNRIDCCPDRLEDVSIRFGDTTTPPEIHFYSGVVPAIAYIMFDSAYTGRYLRLEMNKKEYFTICELELYIPVDGGWSTPGPWSNCSVTCGPGLKTRSRTCTNPVPQHGGADCSGSPTETTPCNQGACPGDGGWSSFGAWSPCTQSCGTGVSIRSRTCTNPPPTAGGADCVGCATEIVTCNTQDCPDSCAAVAARSPGNCNDIRLQNPAAQCGEYNITLPSNAVVTVYCDFLANHGYLFLSDNALSTITSLEGLYDIKDHAVIRILYDNNEQHDVEIAQLMMYKYRFPLRFQLNSYTDFKRPVNWQMTPYVYVGFLPAHRTSVISSMNETKPIQGYMAGGEDITFINCDQNPNSYLVFFGNNGSVAENDYYTGCCDKPEVRAWFENDQLVPPSLYLPSNYFYFYEMHMGGCGGYFTPSHGVNYHVTAATVGLGFEYKDCTP